MFYVFGCWRFQFQAPFSLSFSLNLQFFFPFFLVHVNANVKLQIMLMLCQKTKIVWYLCRGEAHRTEISCWRDTRERERKRLLFCVKLISASLVSAWVCRSMPSGYASTYKRLFYSISICSRSCSCSLTHSAELSCRYFVRKLFAKSYDSGTYELISAKCNIVTAIVLWQFDREQQQQQLSTHNTEYLRSNFQVPPTSSTQLSEPEQSLGR